MLARKADRAAMDSAIREMEQAGMSRDAAAEAVFKERCMPVRDGPSWADYMSTSGRPTDEYDIVALQYTHEGLLSVDENSDGGAAAFGDDIAIECLATEYCREIYVVSTPAWNFFIKAELSECRSVTPTVTHAASPARPLPEQMQAHGADGMVEPSSCLFFLPHSPRGGKDSVQHQPLFLFMKGTGWCGGGGDHYEPVVARPRPSSGVKAAVVL
eukprot:SM000014S00321  [mRNA]  locus=s14:734934:736199:+ [translate_table: standard]